MNKIIRRISISTLLTILLSMISVSVLAYSAGYSSNIFYVGGYFGNQNIFNVGANPPAILPTATTNLFLYLIPIEMAMFVIMVMVGRMRVGSHDGDFGEGEGTSSLVNPKVILMTCIIGIFLVVMYLIVYNMLNVFRGG